jgi:hypothetical protein
MSAVAVEWFDAFDGFDAFGVSSPVAGAADDARTVELLAEVEPGVLAMNLLRGLDVERLDELQRIEVAAAWERQQAWVAAQAQLALAALVSDLPRLPVAEQIKAHEFRKDMIAACLRWSPIAAGNKLAVAERLVSALPLTLAALEGGQISFRHAFVLADAVLDLLPDEVAAVEARVIEKAGGQTVAQFTRSVRRAVLSAAPQLATARHEQAVAGRHVRLVAGVDGMADVIAHLPARACQVFRVRSATVSLCRVGC